MDITTMLSEPVEWMHQDPTLEPVVMTSRVRLARNLTGKPFPGWAKDPQRTSAFEHIFPKVTSLPDLGETFAQPLEELTHLERQVLVERHLISREHAAQEQGSAVIVNKPQTLSIMVNEEDHLRLQTINSGLSIQKSYQQIQHLDQQLNNHFDFAFHPDWGYLTACPTNLGTGMRASAMLHLPGLVLCDEIHQTLNAINHLLLAVRGLYGEGTESLGNLFQISNQSTLGESESDIVTYLERFITKLATIEKQSRLKLLQDDPQMLSDQIGRAYGILKNSHYITSKEALNLISMLRLGSDLGSFPPGTAIHCDDLFMAIQPAHLQIQAGKPLDPENRDIIRAKIIRSRLQSLPPPAKLHP